LVLPERQSAFLRYSAERGPGLHGAYRLDLDRGGAFQLPVTWADSARGDSGIPSGRDARIWGKIPSTLGVTGGKNPSCVISPTHSHTPRPGRCATASELPSRTRNALEQRGRRARGSGRGKSRMGRAAGYFETTRNTLTPRRARWDTKTRSPAATMSSGAARLLGFAVR
jgi:hypothetical protein